MESKDRSDKRQIVYAGVGIPFGAGIGAIVGLVMLDGAIAIGAGAGAGLGLVIGSMVDSIKSRKTGIYIDRSDG